MSEIIINFGSKIFKFSLNPNMAGFVKVVFWGCGGCVCGGGGNQFDPSLYISRRTNPISV